MRCTVAYLRRLTGLCLLAATLAFVGTAQAPGAAAADKEKPAPPTMLWKSYPLEQTPSTPEQAQTPSRRRPAARQSSAGEHGLLTPVLVGTSGLLVVAAALLLLRRYRPFQVRTARRSPEGAPLPASTQRVAQHRPEPVEAEPPPATQTNDGEKGDPLGIDLWRIADVQLVPVPEPSRFEQRSDEDDTPG